ncbi:MAG: 2-dehydropantoate 2-reductase [Promethearchaeota archaeon]|nr:MAG: 2-dehydropantoate 2-reductase [Candidatus Lokiarchaeota archaeon]
MNSKTYKIGFIGAGSIGTLFGGKIASNQSEKYKTEVILFGRKPHIDMVNRNGLRVEENGKVEKVSNIFGFTDIQSYQTFFKVLGLHNFDFLFLTTKAYDIEQSIKDYKMIIEKCKFFVLLQNGLGNEETARNYISDHKIIRALTTDGAFLKRPGLVIHTGEGLTQIGFPFSQSRVNDSKDYYKKWLYRLKEILLDSGFKTKQVDEIQTKCWEKIFVNIGINAFGALTRLENGKLLEIKNLKELMHKAIKEAYEIAKRKNVPLEKKDYTEAAYQVAQHTYNNKNSMLQDILQKKKTEIDYINGKIVEYAREMGKKVPINETLTYLIKGLEESWK